MESSATFNARLVTSPSERVYRIYVKGSDLFFIQLAGFSQTAEVLTVHFGLIGLLIGESMKRRAKKNAETTLQRAGQVDPEELLRENKNNFKVHIPEIREAAIDPPALFAMHGKQAGRWNFSLRDGRKMRFEFENSDELKAALDVLPRLLNATLRINVEWNEIKKRFQKIKHHP
ncbi:MAG: hypothetical protein ABSH11_13850 [Verrucomicrobiota bacterium]|jgi:hypothetical protein